MPANRFFVPHPLTSPLFIEGEELHHLALVMRVHLGDTVEIVNGQGELATAELISLDKKRAEFKISSHHREPPPQQTLILAQALTKHLDWIIEKGTELGVSEFWLFEADFSEKKIPNLLRLHTLSIQALKQSGRLFLPKITFKPSLKEWTLSGSLFYGDVSPSSPLLKGPFLNPTIFFIGPEKGFSKEELDFLSSKAQGISLSSHILRSETAAIAALSQYYITSQVFHN